MWRYIPELVGGILIHLCSPIEQILSQCSTSLSPNLGDFFATDYFDHGLNDSNLRDLNIYDGCMPDEQTNNAAYSKFELGCLSYTNLKFVQFFANLSSSGVKAEFSNRFAAADEDIIYSK